MSIDTSPVRRIREGLVEIASIDGKWYTYSDSELDRLLENSYPKWRHFLNELEPYEIISNTCAQL